MDNWYRMQDKKPEVDDEVQVFNPKYISEDFNPTGVCFGYHNNFGNFVVHVWDNEQQCYWPETISSHSAMFPTHWQPKATPPKM